MAELKNLEQAKLAFATLCRTLEKNDWRYKKDEEALSIECGAQGEDLPMEFSVRVDADRMLVMLLSHMPFKIAEDKRLDVAIAVSAINNALVDGCFDYDVATGNMFFRMTNSIIESSLGEEVFAYMLFCSCQTIDEYNDKLLMVAKGILPIEQCLKTLAN
jgi:hypothetical protein